MRGQQRQDVAGEGLRVPLGLGSRGAFPPEEEKRQDGCPRKLRSPLFHAPYLVRSSPRRTVIPAPNILQFIAFGGSDVSSFPGLRGGGY